MIKKPKIGFVSLGMGFLEKKDTGRYETHNQARGIMANGATSVPPASLESGGKLVTGSVISVNTQAIVQVGFRMPCIFVIIILF